MNKLKLVFTIILLVTAVFGQAGNSGLKRGNSTRTLITEKDTLIDPQSNGYKLVWADEFNKNGPVDTSVWRFEKGFVRNKEYQWYQSENVRCENGYLIIEAKKTHFPNPTYNKADTNWKRQREFVDFTSGSINTAGKKSWKYGRFVMRARINTAMGLWPAFWTLGNQGQWPANGEIDIMEFYRHYLLANIAVEAEPHKALWYSNRKDISTFKDKNWSKKFHVWRMDWDKDGIALYVDDILMNQVYMKDLYNRDKSETYPFQQPQYILLDLAIGGMQGGDPAKTSFPARFEVDYVRVYQKSE
ncbi:Glycosyl hydrolases family 16 [Mucilaginibacter mallensis]|uniref:Glycosyl hydrolases family 16 n=1 Tax=Mucilaginibacter mallensis TaxID=652787 RepID=A0A1H1ZQM9_MUCMA|nr:glycoside hydrolase family 16 protein [Mucilaginibacter mallensis]SDT35950.1 Glycosyl hydrolases family 16 [Mucilaginibacter mallensis]